MRACVRAVRVYVYRLGVHHILPSSLTGTAAIYLPTCPSPAIKRPTSAARSVLNLRVTPDSGSYVFNVSVARGTSGAPSAPPPPSLSLFRFSSFCWYLGASRFEMLYLVVIRVCGLCAVRERVRQVVVCPMAAVPQAGAYIRTVVGRACSSSDDCCCHSSLVLRRTMFRCGSRGFGLGLVVAKRTSSLNLSCSCVRYARQAKRLAHARDADRLRAPTVPYANRN